MIREISTERRRDTVAPHNHSTGFRAFRWS
ncbi:hypothetical protein HD593_008054 [Nonomuraea rubra]|jgi:hypothetical protein|uniref:Uncharacterized protein n=1 Tax=Nonomuraea rubra TaxID=46180 RepID=A0A7X0U398_9ACTN|nr:hypothetical protein [Nonomuraea rubra]